VKVSIDRFSEHLAGTKIAHLFFIYGPEPLQLLECRDKVRERTLALGVEERISFDMAGKEAWGALGVEINAQSLFASARLIEVCLDGKSIDKEGLSLLEKIINSTHLDDYFVFTVSIPSSSKKVKWFNLLESAALSAECRELQTHEAPRWIGHRAQQLFGKQIDLSVCELIAEHSEGNLLGAAQAVEKISLLVGPDKVTLADALQALSDNARFDSYQLIDALLKGDFYRAIRVLRGLKEIGSEPVLVIWTLSRELRQLVLIAEKIKEGVAISQAMDLFRVWGNRKTATERILKRKSIQDLRELLIQLHYLDTIVKGARPGRVWDEIEIFSMAICDIMETNYFLMEPFRA
jgi:DNA polymerase III subunit delta